MPKYPQQPYNQPEETGRFVIQDKSTTIPNKWIIKVMLALAIGSPWLKDFILPEKKDSVTRDENCARRLDIIEKHLDRIDDRFDKMSELIGERSK